MELLRVEGITEKYQAENGEITALDNISFTVDQGEFLSIVGPSGCGKSTLLSIISGLVRPTAGRVFVKDEEVQEISPHIGYMLQRDNLLDWRTVYGNVMLGLELRGCKTPQNIERAERLLKTYGLYEFKDKYPNQMSGGMRQRVALIRTLAVSPDLLLLDEAFSALDYQTRLNVTEDVYQILKGEGITTLMVTHDIPEGISMGDRIMILSPRPAVIREMLTLNFAPDTAAEDCDCVDAPGRRRSPLACRNDPRFAHYCDQIWKELSRDE